MQQNPEVMRGQLGDSVCRNTGFRQLMDRGAVLTYRFTEYKTNRPVIDQSFNKASCVSGQKKK